MIRQPIVKRQRRLDIHLYPKADKYMARRSYPPGVRRPNKSRRGTSDYGLQLKEKQRLRFIYGLGERQLQHTLKTIKKSGGRVSTDLIVRLERRLDNVLYRGGLALTRPQARQLVSHGQVTVNQKRVKQPSYLVGLNDRVDVKKLSAKSSIKGETVPGWLKSDLNQRTITIASIPVRSDIVIELDDQLIAEYYAR